MHTGFRWCVFVDHNTFRLHVFVARSDLEVGKKPAHGRLAGKFVNTAIPYDI